MKQESVKHLADGASALAVSTGLGSSALGYWDYINTNAAGIGVLLSLFFGLIAIGFNFYNSSKLNQSDKNTKLIKALQEEIAAISERKSNK